ncbi:DUF305 domain-containing protein [Starkeya sp. ORNL1]|uniref:CopM family metallochaperone n=1 Tax=Starkeya sp. ORNL1 TaxID=2709380 RepID=UPI00146394ED|nr:DUF305 domain-containing protein [Starkeya sp. ORNL1]QJP17043.1 DUF305 domain-containing protein [Starkeya sp. ORNL1]
MTIIRSAVLGILALALAGAAASAQTMNMPGMDHSSHMQQGAAANPSSEAFERANTRMHQGMTMPFTGDTDIDFAKGMIPHHQGAIDMAKIELQYGKDAEMRKLAEEIIKAQESEIAFLKAWLAKQGK